MRQLPRFLVLSTTLIVGTFAWAADLRGTVINGTTKKVSAGDEVVLLALSEDGMKEEARARTDGRGRFTLAIAEAQTSHLVRVVHQGITYHRMVESGLRSVELEVYDVAPKLDGVTAVMDVQRFEATSETLEVKQLVTVRNDSKPPRTLMNDRPFEVQLPPEAQVQSGLVQIEDGQPLKQRPVPGDQKGQYYFLFPIRPGDTRFAVVYRLPYTGKALIEPKVRNPLEKFVVMLPRSMKFEPMDASVFQPMPQTTPDNVQGTPPVKLGQTVAFHLSGTGALEELKGRRLEAQEAQSSKTPPLERPGGGLGPPIEVPDPLQAYQWQILTGLAVAVVVGAVLVVRRPRSAQAGRSQSATRPVPTRPPNQQIRTRRNGRNRRRVRASHNSSHQGAMK